MTGVALAFTGSESSAITDPVVRTAATRFQQTLRTLLAQRGRGSKRGLADYCGRSGAWVSNFLKPRATQPQITINDLDNIASYFRVSIGELLGVANPKHLSGDEQRLVHAFRVLPPAVQEHFLALIETASIGATVIQNRFKSAAPGRKRVYKESYSIAHVAEISPAVVAEVSALRALLTRISLDASAGATGAFSDQPTANTGTDQAPSGPVAD